MDVRPVVRIQHRARWRALAVADIWAYRGLLLTLGVRDVKLRYKQTLLGVAWVVLQPILSAGILTVVFGRVANIPTPQGIPFFAFAYLGQMAWTLFSLALSRTSSSMIANMSIVLKIYCPRPILPLATIVAVLLDFAIAFALAVPMILMYRQGPLNLPLVVLAAVLPVLCATGLGFIIAALSVRFRDVLYVLPLVLQVGLYASPIAYPLEVAQVNLTQSSPWLFTAYMLNPLASLVSAFRSGLLGQPLLYPGYLVYAAAVSVTAFVIGFGYFRTVEGSFADVI